MANREDIESFIGRLDGAVTSDEVDKGIWVLTPGDESTPIVLVPKLLDQGHRVKVMDLPADGRAKTELMQKLLELNAEGLVHGSYGIESALVVLTDALQLENLDFNEFQSSVESITLALASHMSALASFRE